MAGPARILIVGGGIAGLGLLTALQQRGFQPELIDRERHRQPIGAGIAVQPNALRVLRKLGLGAAVERAGAVIRRWQFRDQRGEVLCDIPLEPLWREVGPFIGIERARLHEVLHSGDFLERLGTWIIALTQDKHRVQVSFNDGSTGRYDFVVGADGLHSGTRRLAFGPHEPIYGGQMVWRSLSPLHLPERDSIQFWLGDGCFFGLCPVGSGTYGFANVTEARRHDEVEGRLVRLRARFAAFGAAVQGFLTSLERDDQIHCGPVEWVEAEQWCRGRVALIGDAAHASSPMMGQGGSMALEDAMVLAECLQAAPEIEVALSTFVARRKVRVNWVRQQSLAVGEMLRLPPVVRNAALRQRGQLAFYDRFQQLTSPP
jgi:2-polyprenyl-6-methoxyphenol hydroxylase-like FAD-dependent oxidoreductase